MPRSLGGAFQLAETWKFSHHPINNRCAENYPFRHACLTGRKAIPEYAVIQKLATDGGSIHFHEMPTLRPSEH